MDAYPMNIAYELDGATVYDVREINSSFASCSLKVMYVGDNRNGSSIPKTAVVNALPTIRNVPIVAHWDREAGTIGSHDVDIVKDKNGNLSLVNLTEPCGVVPDHATFSFKVEEDDNGNKHEYLVIDGVLLWKRQDVYNHIVNDLGGVVKHSMELNVLDGEDRNDGYYEIKKFEFTALCLLETASPCFEGSQLEMYALNDFKSKMEMMMQDLKNTFESDEVPKQESDYIKSKEKYSEEGGNELDTENVNITDSSEGVQNNEQDNTVMQVEVNGETITIPTGECKSCMINYSEDTNEGAEGIEDHEVHEECECDENEPSEENFELLGNVTENIRESIYKVELIPCEWSDTGSTNRYSYVECDIDNKKVYVMDKADGWKLYGFSFSFNGDNVEIDVQSKARMKWAIVEYDEGSTELPVASMYEAMENKVGEYELKIKEYASEIEDANKELEALRAFKTEVEENEIKEAKNSVLERFNYLEEVEEFNNLKENADKYTVEEIEEKCFAIKGKFDYVSKQEFELKPAKIIVETRENSRKDDYVPYGGIVEKYKRISR